METFNSPNNLVKLSFEDHVKAHELRFQVYGEAGDNIAVLRMKGLAEEGMKLMQQEGGRAVNAKLQEEGRLMHSPTWQREMGRRSMARPDALEIRRRAGQKGSRTRHLNRTVRAEDRYLWFYRGVPFLCTFGFNHGGDLKQELYKAKQTPLERVSPLIRGTKKSLHGWSCQLILILEDGDQT